MLPQIRYIASIEMLRDGGSLEAEFVGTNGSRYCLHFKLIAEEDASSQFVRLGYEQPMVFERREIREENRIEWHAINQVEVSWIHARVLLHQLRAFLQSNRDSKWLTVMEEIANTEGEIPKDIPRVLGPGSHLGHDG